MGIDNSSILETLVETGILGVGLFLSVWVTSFWNALKYRNENSVSSEIPILWTGLAGGLLGLLVHSALDVDWSFPAIPVAAYAVFGIWRSAFPTFRKPQKSERKGPEIKIAAAGIAAALMVITTPSAIAAWSHRSAGIALSHGDVARAVSLYKRATVLDPLNAEYHVAYGDLLLRIASVTGDGSYVKEGANALEKAIKLDSHNPDYHMYYANYVSAVGDYDAALAYRERASELDPKTPVTYEWALREALANTKRALEDNDRDAVVEYLGRAQVLIDRFEENCANQPDGFSKGHLMAHTPGLDAKIAQYWALSGDLSKAADTLAQLRQKKLDQDLLQEVLLWQCLVEGERGNQDLASEAEAALLQINAGAEEEIRALRSLLQTAITMK